MSVSQDGELVCDGGGDETVVAGAGRAGVANEKAVAMVWLREES